MANTPKKVKDPTEVALSAIQEALNISDVSASEEIRGTATDEINAPSAVFDEKPFDARLLAFNVARATAWVNR